MQTIRLTATIDENHRLTIDLPQIPPGPVEIIVKAIENQGLEEEFEPGTREWARAKLKASGLLAEDEEFPELEGFEELSDEEEEQLGRLFAGDRPVEDYVNEDREERF